MRIKDIPLFIIAGILLAIGDNNNISVLTSLGASGITATLLFYLINVFFDTEGIDTYKVSFWVGWAALFIVFLFIDF